jgi:hypothetical protein
MTDAAMTAGAKYRVQQIILGFRANAAHVAGTTPADGYREFYVGFGPPGSTDHPTDSGDADQLVVGCDYTNDASFPLQFPNGEYEYFIDVDLPDEFDLWRFSTDAGVAMQIHSGDSPAIGQDTAGSPVAVLEVEVWIFVQRVG